MYGGSEWSQESPVGRLRGGRSGVWFPSRQEIFTCIFRKLFRGSTRYRSSKVAGSIPDGVIGIFHWHNPSCRSMALGWTQPLTERVPGIFPRGQWRPLLRADNLTNLMCRLSWNSGSLELLEPSGSVHGLLYLYLWATQNISRAHPCFCSVVSGAWHGQLHV
jgi:hypothetical protein